MTDKEVMQMAMDIMESAIKAGDWVVDGACDPDLVLNALRAALAQPEHPDTQGSPCPEFWNWLPKAYGQTESFSKYNMEVAYLAGKKAQPELEPVAWLDSDGFPWSDEGIACRSIKDTYKPLYTAPPQREWQGLTDEEKSDIDAKSIGIRSAMYLTEAKLKEKNT